MTTAQENGDVQFQKAAVLINKVTALCSWQTLNLRVLFHNHYSFIALAIQSFWITDPLKDLLKIPDSFHQRAENM